MWFHKQWIDCNEFMINQSSVVSDLHNPIVEAYPSSTVLEGDRMLLSCLTESTMPVNYYWLKNDANITEALSNQLVINSTTRSDIGKYKCVVFNGLGYNTSTELNVTVLCKYFGAVKFVVMGIRRTLQRFDFMSLPSPRSFVCLIPPGQRA